MSPVSTPNASGSASVSDTAETRTQVLVIGPVPAPHHGVAVLTRTLLDSRLADRFDLLHLDTSDRRDVKNIGRFDTGNVRLALLHGVRYLGLSARAHIDIVYAPLSQNSLGFMRDMLFLGPALARGKCVVLHLHGGRYDHFVRSAPAPVRWLARSVFRRARRIIVLGDSLRGMLDGLAPPERVVVVPNAVADPGTAPPAEASSRMRVLFLGNLIPSKGYADLVRAVQTLLDEGLDVDVTFAGAVVDPMFHAGVLAAADGQAERIRFAGAVDTAAKNELLRNSDVVALPSYYENEAHPLVLLEAMAAGLPVVSTRHAAIPEIVVDGVTGILIDPRDATALTAVLRRCAREPRLRLEMGRAARQRYEERFTVQRWADRMERVLCEAAQGR